MNQLEPRSAAGDPAQKPAVLLVDDEQPLLDVFASSLSSFIEVTLASSAREADSARREQSFKVVVTDHPMPGGNGMELLTRTRKEFPHLQRVLVTGYMKPELLMRSVNEAAVFRYLLKPVVIGEFIDVVLDAANAHDLSVAAA